jgi:hypothetical protein
MDSLSTTWLGWMGHLIELTLGALKLKDIGVRFDPLMCMWVTIPFNIISMSATTHSTTTSCVCVFPIKTLRDQAIFLIISRWMTAQPPTTIETSNNEGLHQI